MHEELLSFCPQRKCFDLAISRLCLDNLCSTVNDAGDNPYVTLASHCRGTLKWRDGRNHVGDFKEGLEHG